MTYLRIYWVHSFPNEPLVLYTEIDADRWETRKVEEFPDGRLGFAAADVASNGTKLSVEPIPLLADIGSDPQFRPAEINRAEFEAVWQKATGQR